MYKLIKMHLFFGVLSLWISSVTPMADAQETSSLMAQLSNTNRNAAYRISGGFFYGADLLKYDGDALYSLYRANTQQFQLSQSCFFDFGTELGAVIPFTILREQSYGDGEWFRQQNVLGRIDVGLTQRMDAQDLGAFSVGIHFLLPTMTRLREDNPELPKLYKNFTNHLASILIIGYLKEIELAPLFLTSAVSYKVNRSKRNEGVTIEAGDVATISMGAGVHFFSELSSWAGLKYSRIAPPTISISKIYYSDFDSEQRSINVLHLLPGFKLDLSENVSLNAEGQVRLYQSKLKFNNIETLLISSIDDQGSLAKAAIQLGFSVRWL